MSPNWTVSPKTHHHDSTREETNVVHGRCIQPESSAREENRSMRHHGNSGRHRSELKHSDLVWQTKVFRFGSIQLEMKYLISLLLSKNGKTLAKSKFPMKNVKFVEIAFWWKFLIRSIDIKYWFCLLFLKFHKAYYKKEFFLHLIYKGLRMTTKSKL